MCWEDIPIIEKRQKKTFLLKQSVGSLTISENLNAIMNCRMPPQWPIFLYIVKKWNICFYLNFSFYLSASQPQIVTRGRRWAARRGDHNIQYLHMFFRWQWGLLFFFFKTLLKPPENNWFVLQWLVSFSWCWPVSFRPTVSEHICPLLSFIRHQHKTRDKIILFLFILFCFNESHDFATARCLWLNAWWVFMFLLLHDGAWLCWVVLCLFVRLKTNVGV